MIHGGSGRLRDQVALVTGASSGIGRNIALALSAEGATVVLVARRGEVLAELVRELQAIGGVALAVAADLTSEDQVVDAFRRTMDSFGRLDTLVNGAGTRERAPLEQLTLPEWQRVVDINLTAAFLCSRQAFRIMKEQRRGRIINVGSVSAKVPRPHSIAYTSTKFALDGLTRSLALDGRAHGIAVSIVHPGLTLPTAEGAVDKVASMTPEEVARVVTLMASLPDRTNLLEAVVLPVRQPFLGRG